MKPEILIIAILSGVAITILFSSIALYKTRRSKLERHFQEFQRKKEAGILLRMERQRMAREIINSAFMAATR